MTHPDSKFSHVRWKLSEWILVTGEEEIPNSQDGGLRFCGPGLWKFGFCDSGLDSWGMAWKLSSPELRIWNLLVVVHRVWNLLRGASLGC